MNEAPVKLIRQRDYSALPNPGRMPTWIRQNLGNEALYGETAGAVHQRNLHTVCEEARCPNRGECWSRGTATFMLLGDTCTRACAFCSVVTGKPHAVDMDEPRRVADAIIQMNLHYVVLTSVNRDDLPDGGAGIFAATLNELIQRRPDIGLEILTPDFQRCQTEAVEAITTPIHATSNQRLVWGHNIETVPRLYDIARRGSKYGRSLNLLKLARSPQVETKSAIMLGLGETRAEVLEVMRDLRDAGVSRIAIGQYLRPTRAQLPVQEYISPEAFAAYAEEARALGFTWVKSGPLVRSSYHAEE